MRRSILVIAVLSLLWLAVMPAHADVSVGVTEFRFSPATITVPQGEDVSWHDGGNRAHTSTQDGPLALWNTGRIEVGGTSESVAFPAAGSYAYHCMIHPFMHGMVRVPLIVSPARGTRMTTFRLRLASSSQAGFTYDLQKRKGTGAWKTWKTKVAALSLRFRLRKGHFSFRSRLHRTSPGATSGWSPTSKVTVH